ncbi:hypothetical protein [Anaerotalea alkaliphila]|uniref:Uncharacterized protein n=1 Tax=Anaerotalea alkaliphila TaxID=2662126 RepID=A0A7X5HU70_9FIRM|nr:hypothetical protein [Anaerotalea alkaliphila]NDL66741.1 hypothetical protein [Anaerotalea alkaliphila]
MRINGKVLKEGLHVGLVAFLTSYAISLVLSVVVNLAVMDEISVLLQGVLSDHFQAGAASILRVAAIIQNLSMYNMSGDFKIGLLVFAVIPFVSFWLADREDNAREGLDARNLGHYVVSSLTFSVLLSLLSWGAGGTLLSVRVDFFSWQNAMTTMVAAFFIQVVIALNYGRHFGDGVASARKLVRILLAIGLAAGLAGLVFGVVKYIGDLVTGFFLVLVLLPNVAVYGMFLLMGMEPAFSQPMRKMLELGGVDLGGGLLPPWVRLIGILVFLGIGIHALAGLRREGYLKQLAVCNGAFAAFSVLMAFATGVNLGIVKNVVHIQFGIPLLQALLLPLVLLSAVGLGLFLVRKILDVLRN